MRGSFFIEYKGKTYNSTDLAKTYGVNPTTFRRRLRDGWGIERALHEPVDTKHSGRKKGKPCRATNWEECFKCKLPDCVRSVNRKLQGEPTYYDIHPKDV